MGGCESSGKSADAAMHEDWSRRSQEQKEPGTKASDNATSGDEAKGGWEQLPLFKAGARKFQIKDLPSAWAPNLKQLEQMNREKFGLQMQGNGGGWFAEDRECGPVFVKTFNRSNTKAAQAEFALYDRFNGDSHPNAATPFKTIMEKQASIMLELLAGGDLFDHIYRAHYESKKPYSEDEVRRMIAWVMKGTAFIHSHAVAHRDLKTENIMGGARSEYLKLVDFGLSKYYQAVADQLAAAAGPEEVDRVLRSFQDPDSSRGGNVVSKQFTSPEQRSLGTTSNPFANDVWSIGQVLYLMMTGKMPKSTPQKIGVCLSQIPEDKMSQGCKDVIIAMTAPESDRLSIHEALRLPWVGEAQSTEALGSEVLEGLLKLSQKKKVPVKTGDWFVREVGTDGAHVIEDTKMGPVYDLAAGLKADDLSEEQKSQMSNWELADNEDMMWYPATKTREFVLINEATVDLLLAKFDKLRTSWNGDSVEVENAADVPSNKEVFDFVTDLLNPETSSSVSLRVSTFQKKGVFAQQMTIDGSVMVAYTKTEERPAKVFVYKSPWDTSAHDTLMLCPGDALVYRPEKTRVHTMEKLAIENNFTLID